MTCNTCTDTPVTKITPLPVEQIEFTVQQGDDEEYLVHLVHQIDLQENTYEPVDLKDIQRIDMHIRQGKEIVLELSTENAGIEILDKTKGYILIKFKSADTQDLKPSTLMFDLQLKSNPDTGSKIRTVLKGKVCLLGDITVVKN